MIFLIKYLFCFIPKLSFKFIENITQCTEKLKRTFLAFQFRYLLIWHKNRRCDATCIFDECTDKELFFYLAAQNHLKVFKNKKIISAKKKEPSQKKKIEIKPIFIGVNTKIVSQKYYKNILLWLKNVSNNLNQPCQIVGRITVSEMKRCFEQIMANSWAFQTPFESLFEKFFSVVQ